MVPAIPQATPERRDQSSVPPRPSRQLIGDDSHHPMSRRQRICWRAGILFAFCLVALYGFMAQRDTFYKALHVDTGLYIQLRCDSDRKPRLTDAKRATYFRSREQAILCLRPLGPVAIEIECHVA